ncbi:Rho GTPase activation protein [Spinellus fusiger]|nr:Rho GTPase activation protein [Spinellus fusiger]
MRSSSLLDPEPKSKKWQSNPLAFIMKSSQHLFGSSTRYNSVQPKASMIKGIFGAPLEYAAMCGSMTFNTPLGLCVPDPVHCCFSEIMKRGLAIEGIFRLSGAASEVLELESQFDQPPTYGKHLDLSHYDIHSIVSVIKKYLRNLPDSVIPFAFHDRFLQAADPQRSSCEIITSLSLIIAELPVAHNHLLHYIIILASHIQSHESTNMMNPEALATVLAPVCTGLEHTLRDIPSALRKKKPKQLSKTDMYHVIQRNTQWTQVWAFIIEHHEDMLQNWKEQPGYTLSFHKVNKTVPSRPLSPSTHRPSSLVYTSYQAFMQQFYTPTLPDTHTMKVAALSEVSLDTSPAPRQTDAYLQPEWSHDIQHAQGIPYSNLSSVTVNSDSPSYISERLRIPKPDALNSGGNVYTTPIKRHRPLLQRLASMASLQRPTTISLKNI